MPQKKGGMDIFRRMDRLAKPVTLRLDKQRNYGTPVGGVITITGLTIMIAMVTYRLLTQFGFYQVTYQTQALSNDDGTEPYNLSLEKVIFAVYLYSSEQGVQQNINQYYSLVYGNKTFDEDTNVWAQTYTALVPCDSLNLTDQGYPDNFAPWFEKNVYGMYCLQDNQNNMYLQGFGVQRDVNEILGYIVQAPCASVTDYTNQTDCVPQSESLLYANTIESQLKIFQFTTNDRYIVGNRTWEDSYYYQEKQINAGYQVNVTQQTTLFFSVEEVKVNNNWFFSHGFEKATQLFKVIGTQYANFGSVMGQYNTQIENAFLVYEFVLDETLLKSTYRRQTLTMIFGEIGGLIFLLINIGHICNNSSADFAIDNMLKRKLYSVKKGDDVLYSQKHFPEQQFGNPGYFFEYLNTHTSFFYTYHQYLYRKCCRWRCCCQPYGSHLRAADRISDKAQERLVHEIDLIQIVRQLRISAFLNQFNFQQYQVDLLHYFQQYCVTDNHTQYDLIAEHPGQFVEHVKQKHYDAVTAENIRVSDLAMTRRRRRVVIYRDHLEQVNKDKMADQLEREFHAFEYPMDLEILKNILGEEFDEKSAPAINEEIINYQDQVLNTPRPSYDDREDRKLLTQSLLIQ